MTTLVALWLISIFSMDYLTDKLGIISRYAILVPELLTLVFTVIIVGRSIVLKQWEQPARYAWLFLALVLACMIGVVAEAVDPGPLVSGIRNHFKWLPMLLLPAVYRFSDRQLKILLGVFLFIAILQVPLAFFQRFVQFADLMHTGDPVTGTVATSNSLTMILAMAVALIVTLYIHRKAALSVAIVFFFFLAAPMAINETKATLILLPLATVGPFLLSHGVESKWRSMAPILAMCVVGLVAFVTIYNLMIQERWWGGGGAINEFISRGHWEWYLYRGAEVGNVPDIIGRVDSMLLPLYVLSAEWMQFLFGLGIGNVSSSFLPGMEGAYFEIYRDYGYGQTSIGDLLWEVGIVGLLIYLTVFYFAWRDAKAFAKAGTDMSWLGTWWSICLIVFLFGLVYKSIFNFNELGYTFFFWSGVIASRNWHSVHPEAVERNPVYAPKLQLAGRLD